MPSAEDGGLCSLVEGVLKAGSKEEFLGSLRRLCSNLRAACRSFSAATTLFGGGDVRVSELPDDLRRVVEESTARPPVGGAGWFARVFLGVRASGADDVIGVEGALVVRHGGVGEWVCGEFAKRVEALSSGLRCLEGVEGRAEALVTLSRSLRDPNAGGLRAALARVSESVLSLLPGVSRYVTLAWLLRFASIPVIREGLRGCGFRGVNVLEALLKEFSPALFDLSECRLYWGAEGLPKKLLGRGDYLITSGFVTVRREGWEGRDYVIYGEEVPASPTYGFLNALSEGWVRAEELLFGASPTLKLLEGFVEGNIRGAKPKLSARGRRVVEAVLRGEEFKVVTIPGKDAFSSEDRALVLELTQAVACGIMNASVGWDGVRRGNAVINRYAVRFRPTHVLRASRRVRALVIKELLR